MPAPKKNTDRDKQLKEIDKLYEQHWKQILKILGVKDEQTSAERLDNGSTSSNRKKTSKKDN